MGSFPVTVSVPRFYTVLVSGELSMSMPILQCSVGDAGTGVALCHFARLCRAIWWRMATLEVGCMSLGKWYQGVFLHEGGSRRVYEREISLVSLIPHPSWTLRCCLLKYQGYYSSMTTKVVCPIPRGDFIIPCSNLGISFRGVQWERDKGIFNKP